MDLQIRIALEKDMPEVLKLIKELATFEREPNAVEITVEDLIQDGFGDRPEFICFVVEVNNIIEGMALVYKRYSTWKGIVLHLEDLIVTKGNRGLGIGEKLFNHVVTYANEIGVKRMSWVVLDWNQPAFDFYNKRGAKMMDDWRVVHLDEQGIKNYLFKINNESI